MNNPIIELAELKKEMNLFGYTWQGMTPVTEKDAVKFFNQGVEVFRLYSDNTEGLVESLEEIEQHERIGGMFGIEDGADTKSERAMALINGAIYALYKEKLDQGNYGFHWLAWCEVVDEDNEPHLIEICKRNTQKHKNWDEQAIAVCSLSEAMKDLTSSHAYKESSQLIYDYMEYKERETKEEEE